MLTQNAKKGFDELLGICLLDSLKSSDFLDWDIRKKNDFVITESEVIMLTISSNNFRMFLMLHFSKNQETTNYIAKLLKIDSLALDSRRFYDYISEIGNGFCGIYKRELSKYFPFLGMSTPNLMASETLNYLHIWHHDHESHCIANYNNEINFYGSVYVSSYDDVDFKYQSNSLDENVESGELEFF